MFCANFDPIASELIEMYILGKNTVAEKWFIFGINDSILVIILIIWWIIEMCILDKNTVYYHFESI